MINTNDYRKYLESAFGGAVTIGVDIFKELLDDIDNLQKNDPDYKIYMECKKYNVTPTILKEYHKLLEDASSKLESNTKIGKDNGNKNVIKEIWLFEKKHGININ